MLHVVIVRVVVVDAVHGGFTFVRTDCSGLRPERGSELVHILDFLVRCVDGSEDEVRGILVVDERVLLRTVADLEGRGGLFVAVGCQRVADEKKKIKRKYPLNEALLITIAGGEISHPSLRARCHFLYMYYLLFLLFLRFFFFLLLFFLSRAQRGEEFRRLQLSSVVDGVLCG